MRVILVAAIVSLLSTSAMAAEFDFTEGRLFQKDGMMTRLITLTNNTGSDASVAIECGFFRSGVLQGNGVAMFWSIGAGETAYGEATAVDVSEADETRCRVGAVDRHDSQ